MTPDSIFDRLTKTRTPHAVVCGVVRSRRMMIDHYSNDYFVIIHGRDKRKHANLFYLSEEKPSIYYRTMTKSEIQEFKARMDEYIKVMHTADGRVYEQKNYSFREYIKN